ncbi:MAG TPA: M14 family zinc carboxypeptidase, partial [Symbiobacteriaceae bacterium]|nr:M14 family zinc carboxypeptidase [Symbiobacteriaceae bacterium]
VMYMLDRYAAEASEGRAVSELLGRVSIWFVPMVNPDGVTLHQQGLEAFPPEVREGILAINGGSSDFSGWKANAEGVDLNLQYPAEWESLRWNGTVPAFAHYKGAAPLTAPETRAMTAFTYAVDPEITVSYHATGRILYWHFHNRPEHLERDRRLAEQFGALTGYVLVQPEANPSGGGYKDWFVQTFGRPGFTPEIAAYGDGSPPGPAQFAEEWERNRLVGLFVAQEGWVLFAARNRVNLTVAGTPLLPGVLVGRHSFVSLPEALRALGISFAWDEAAGRLVAREGENSLILTAGAAEAVRNGELVALPSPPMVVQGQLWAPVRLMADTFGVRLDWEDATRTVALTR